MPIIKYLILFIGLFTSVFSLADTIFSDDFQDGNINGWTISGTGTNASANLYAGNYSLRLQYSKTASYGISTLNYSDVSISSAIAAYSLESGEQCITEVSADSGSSWTAVNTVADGQDNGVTLYSATASPSAISNNASVVVRLRANGNNNQDYCYFDNIQVSGTPDSTPVSCDYDCLSGNGNVTRAELTYATLQTAGNGSLVDMSAFTIPEGAANPSNTFTGTLAFNAVVRGWSSVKDTYNYAAITDVKKLPDFNYQFVQHGTHLIPVDRGLKITSHYLWELILEPGRVWDETGDNGYSRASVPFSLQEYSANCTHNGVLSFLFKSDGAISNVAYEIASETCAYYQFNLWGRLNASYTPASVSNASQLQYDYEQEVANRMPTKALSELASDYPTSGINLAVIGSEQTQANISTYGVAYNGTHYSGSCDTRYGTYPYCSVMSLPSYSLAKSTYTSYGLMALEERYSGSKNLKIGDYVTGCPNSRWGDVSFENTLDMATGNYTSAGFEVDES